MHKGRGLQCPEWVYPRGASIAGKMQRCRIHCKHSISTGITKIIFYYFHILRRLQRHCVQNGCALRPKTCALFLSVNIITKRFRPVSPQPQKPKGEKRKRKKRNQSPHSNTEQKIPQKRKNEIFSPAPFLGRLCPLADARMGIARHSEGRFSDENLPWGPSPAAPGKQEKNQKKKEKKKGK